MQAVLFDSSIYISALRSGNVDILSVLQKTFDEVLWLSAVVLEELYAGALASELEKIEEMERDFERIDGILVPSRQDWVQTGKVLHWLGARYGYENIGRGRFTNDALIATSASRFGIRVITANGRDFSRLAQFCSLSWQLVAL
jgi:predicted nucleic acid-binding protein